MNMQWYFKTMIESLEQVKLSGKIEDIQIDLMLTITKTAAKQHDQELNERDHRRSW